MQELYVAKAQELFDYHYKETVVQGSEAHLNYVEETAKCIERAIVKYSLEEIMKRSKEDDTWLNSYIEN